MLQSADSANDINPLIYKKTHLCATRDALLSKQADQALSLSSREIASKRKNGSEDGPVCIASVYGLP